MNDRPPVLAIEHLSKTFPGQIALRDVSLDVRAGEIHALVGENGSGKSTLIKCLAGYHQPDHGAVIRVEGEPMPEHFGPDVSAARGLVFVHQDLGLIPTLSVMENLALSVGYAKRRGGRIDWRAQKRRAMELLRSTGHAISPSTLVGSLSRADQTLVALARVLSVQSGVKVAVFDEPTASLTPDEVPRLFRAIRNMAAEGAGVIYVSHRLEEILDLADRVTVLRDGRRVITASTSGMSKSDLVRHIVGDEVAQSIGVLHDTQSASSADDAEVVLRVSELVGPGVGPVTFELRRGEILGIAGLLGAGRTELAQLLFGAAPRSGGRIELFGRPLTLKSPADAIKAGLALVPEDRLGQGTFPSLSVRENAVLLRLRSMWSGFRLSSRRESKATRGLIQEFNVRPADGERALALLSGGNQQKVVLGKWITQGPKVLILDEPMQGIDIGAKSEVAQIIRRSAAAGMSVILIDSDFEHFMELSDRILVLSRGTQTATLAGQHITRDRVMEMAFHVPEAHEEDAIHA